MKLLFESWRRFLTEDVYSSELRDFIRLSRKTEKFSNPLKRLKILHQYMDTKKSELIPGKEGSFRKIYWTREREILKMVLYINDRPDELSQSPRKQNKIEIEIFNRDKYGIFPKVMEYDTKDYLWFVVEEVIPLSDEPSKTMEKMFPKLTSVVEGISGRKGHFSHHGLEIVRKMLEFYKLKQQHITTDTKSKTLARMMQELLRSLNYDHYRVSLGDEHQQDNKESIEKLYEYYNNPDPNFFRLRNAFVEEQLDQRDFYSPNVGCDEDYNIKLFDIAFGEVG